MSCILSVLCILIHGIVDVARTKDWNSFERHFLIGITFKPDNRKDNCLQRHSIVTFQILAVGFFSLGLVLIHAQWFSLEVVVFSDKKTQTKKIQSLYDISIDSAKEKDVINKKKYLLLAINLTERLINRSPLDSDLHYTRAKLYSLLDGNEDKIKSSLNIESELDPNWVNLPLRQAKVLLFYDLDETRKCWINALERADNSKNDSTKSIWRRILAQAKQHPILTRDTYKLITYKNDSYFINQ